MIGLAQHHAVSTFPIFTVLIMICLWRIFIKAGQPGWAAIIPLYNLYILIRVAGEPNWWFILMIIPVFNVIIYFALCIAISQRFGRGAGFTLGLFFLPFIFYPILAFSDAQYSPAL